MKPLGITEKITIAGELFESWSEALRADSGISGRLRELSARAVESEKACVRSGVAEACRRCDQEEGGSCCGAGIEKRFTPELLLINLLLGVNLKESRYSAASCHFLDEHGCMLVAKDILCLNYLCLKLQKKIPTENLRRLQETNGLEMETLFILHDRIRNFIRNNR